MGGMKGPRSFEVAGEIADGLHHALSYSRTAYDYVVDHVKVGAERAGRNWQDLDLGAWIVSVVPDDSAGAKRAARILVPSTAQTGIQLRGRRFWVSYSGKGPTVAPTVPSPRATSTC